MTTTFFNVSPPFHSRSSRRNSGRAFEIATSASIVGVSGVSSTWAAGSSATSTSGAGGTTVDTASVLAA